jgi:uncharacterized protein YegL
MMSGKVQHVIGILDRSGSMVGKRDDTVGGINTMINELKMNASNDDIIKISLKLFDHEEIILWNCKPLNEVTELSVSDFIPRGSTALLDALGNTLNYFMKRRAINPNDYDSCLIYLATDGLDNASNRYSKEQIKVLIREAKEKYNIDVIYLGANQNAILEANNIGINPGQAINYSETSDNTSAVYRAVGRVANSQRSLTPNILFSTEERDASISTDFENLSMTGTPSTILRPTRQCSTASRPPYRR